jgi:chorismate mutase
MTDDVTTLPISSMRKRIDEIDAAIIELWQERAGLSQQIGQARLAAGGTRLVLSREQQIMDRFRAGIGDEGTQLALLVLRAGRGAL